MMTPPGGSANNQTMMVVVVGVVVVVGAIAFFVLNKPKTKPIGVPGAPTGAGAPTLIDAGARTDDASAPIPVTGELTLTSSAPMTADYNFCDVYNATQKHGTSSRKCFDMDWSGWLTKGTSDGLPLKESGKCWGKNCGSYKVPFKGGAGDGWCELTTVKIPPGVNATAWQFSGHAWSNDSGACTTSGNNNPSAQKLTTGVNTLTSPVNCALYFELAPGYTCPSTPSPTPSPAS